MDAVAINILLAIFILSIFWESCESYNLNHTIPAKYDTRTDVVRLRRQSPEHSCKGDISKFQCATTADCISAELECDGKEDCRDGSDEKESLCKDYPKKCTLPAQPAHGYWINLRNDRIDHEHLQIDGNSVLKYSCNSGYKLSATVETSVLVHCLPNGRWSLTVLPVCQKLCQSLYNTPFITVSCRNEGSPVRCDKATDNTIVTYKCAPHYEAPYGRPKSSTCYDGVWDYIPDCIPVCGEKRVSATPLIVNGQEVERGHYPWVVALYSRKDSDPYFKNICGGSLLTTDVVLTAAHCVSQKETGNIYNAKYFRVGAGKYYNLHEDSRDADTAQYADVDLIEAYREYKGEIQNFRADIALLKLKTNLVLSSVVQPVCYNNLPIIEPNTVGLVTGWGYTISSGEPSETLKELELPYNADEQCLKYLDKDFSDRYFTPDKLCAGFNNQNTSVCSGDSGGGLVFRNPSFKRRYFIHGIVSLAHSYKENQKTHCNIQRSALFTKVENYVEWIQLKVRHWTSTRNNTKKCRAPAQPEHGRWAYLDNSREDESNHEIDANTAIKFSCNKGYQLSDTNEDSLTMLCIPTGKWNVTVLPLCQIGSSNNFFDTSTETLPALTARPPNSDSKKCRTPAQPEHGQWAYLNNPSKNESNQEIDANTAIIFSCNQGYQLSDTNEDSLTIFCMTTGKWSVTVMPLCQQLCPSIYNGLGITASCKKNGSSIPCGKATDDTVLSYKCAPYYEAAYGTNFSSVCSNGFWHSKPICNPVCGEKRASEKPLLVGEDDVEQGDHPWLVSLYSNKDSDPNFTNTCSGSLITPEIILTAANCVAMPETGEIVPARYFRVKAGRYYTQYKDPRDGADAQYSEVAGIATPEEYKGEVQGDIALLKLKTSMILSKDVQPVCYDELPPLHSPLSGEVTGRRYSTSTDWGNQPETLRQLEVTYIKGEQCVKNLDKDFANRYLSSDKICVEYKEKSNTSVCRGSSGEGLVFERFKQHGKRFYIDRVTGLGHYKPHEKRYHIEGVTGLGHGYNIRNGTDCNIPRATLFTKVSTYIKWIQLKVQQWTTENIKK